MELSSDLIYIVTIASSIGGSYVLMNYRTTDVETKVKAIFKKIDDLNSKIIIIGEQIKSVEKDKDEIIKLTNIVNKLVNEENNFITINEAESKFITRNEFTLYIDSINKIQSKIEDEIEKLNSKLDKIYMSIVSNINNNITQNINKPDSS